MGVPRYTTPVFTLTFTEKDLDLTQASDVYVTFTQASTSITVGMENLEVAEKTISVSFTQEETARFCVGDVSIQANWMTGNKRASSEVVTYEFTEQLLTRVIQ